MCAFRFTLFGIDSKKWKIKVQIEKCIRFFIDVHYLEVFCKSHLSCVDNAIKILIFHFILQRLFHNRKFYSNNSIQGLIDLVLSASDTRVSCENFRTNLSAVKILEVRRTLLPTCITYISISFRRYSFVFVLSRFPKFISLSWLFFRRRRAFPLSFATTKLTSNVQQSAPKKTTTTICAHLILK